MATPQAKESCQKLPESGGMPFLWWVHNNFTNFGGVAQQFHNNLLSVTNLLDLGWSTKKFQIFGGGWIFGEKCLTIIIFTLFLAYLGEGTQFFHFMAGEATNF